MKLDNPGVGEITDRLTILAMKILFGEQAKIDTSHFKAERATLLAKIRSRTLNGAWFDSTTDLAATNAALWHAEDDLRAFRTAFQAAKPPILQSEQIVDLAFKIQALNDRRAELVQKINKDAGEGADGPEKVQG